MTTNNQYPDTEPTLNHSEILKQIDENISIEEQAIAVLGNASEKCTADQGYLPRQALYACLTCKIDSDKHPLLCYACSENCHDNETCQIIELFTKRYTKCDCPRGNCTLSSKNNEPNKGNIYNQNSQKGTYCLCQRPYPDEEDPIVDEMHQCVICEDWYHSRCLFPDQVTVENNEVKFISDEFLDKLLSDESEVTGWAAQFESVL